MKKMNPLHCLTEVIDVEIKAQEASSSSDSENSCDESPLLRSTSTRGAPTTTSFGTPTIAGPSSTNVGMTRSSSSLEASHQIKNLFRSDLSVVTFNRIEYLIGVQVARRLKRKTFNMYRCMKKKKIELRRATQEEVDYLTLVGAVHPGTHSITLVPFVECLCFVADALFRHIRFPNEDVTAKRRKSFVTMHPRIHRRKPLPWDIQRAVRKTTPPPPPSTITLPAPSSRQPSSSILPAPLPSRVVVSTPRTPSPLSPLPSPSFLSTSEQPRATLTTSYGIMGGLSPLSVASICSSALTSGRAPSSSSFLVSYSS